MNLVKDSTIDRFPGVSFTSRHRGVKQQPARLRKSALGQPTAPHFLSLVIGTRIQTQRGHEGIRRTEPDALKGVGEADVDQRPHSHNGFDALLCGLVLGREEVEGRIPLWSVFDADSIFHGLREVARAGGSFRIGREDPARSELGGVFRTCVSVIVPRLLPDQACARQRE